MSHVNEHGSEPSRFLVDTIALLPSGRALDIAMGGGRNAIYLAQAGFDVEGVDKSPEAVETAREAAKCAGVTITARVADLEGDYRIERDAYSVIVCFNYLQRPLIPRIKEGIRRGGMVVYETFTVVQAQYGRPYNPDYLLKHNELLEMFREFRCLRYYEGVVENRKAVAALLAQKV